MWRQAFLSRAQLASHMNIVEIADWGKPHMVDGLRMNKMAQKNNDEHDAQIVRQDVHAERRRLSGEGARNRHREEAAS